MKKTLLIPLIFFLMAGTVQAEMRQRFATPADIKLLKGDLLSGRLDPARVTLTYIRHNYGDPATIKDAGDKITYNYGDIELLFIKSWELAKWSATNSGKYDWTLAQNQLRDHLAERRLLVGEATLEEVIENFGQPDEIDEVGHTTLVFYGDVSLVFKAKFYLDRWKAKNFSPNDQKGVLQSK